MEAEGSRNLYQMKRTLLEDVPIMYRRIHICMYNQGSLRLKLVKYLEESSDLLRSSVRLGHMTRVCFGMLEIPKYFRV